MLQHFPLVFLKFIAIGYEQYERLFTFCGLVVNWGGGNAFFWVAFLIAFSFLFMVICSSGKVIDWNKKVLLRERKRHTDRGVSSTPSVNWSGLPPVQVWRGATQGGVPPCWGTPHQSTLHPGLTEGTQGGVPPVGVPPVQVWWGYPHQGTPICYRGYLRWGTHQGTPIGVPSSKSDGEGVPKVGYPIRVAPSGYPHAVLMGGPKVGYSPLGTPV